MMMMLIMVLMIMMLMLLCKMDINPHINITRQYAEARQKHANMPSHITMSIVLNRVEFVCALTT